MTDKFKTIFGKRTLRKLNDMATRLDVTGDRVQKGPNGTIVLPPPRQYLIKPFPWGADHLWGLVSVSGALVTIASGEYAAGAGAPLTTGQTTFTVTKDPTYIGIEYSPSLGALTLLGPGVSGYTETDRPTPGNGVFRAPLYLFSFDGVNAYYQREYLYLASAALYAFEPGT